MPADIYYQAADDILADIGAAPTAAAVDLLVAWMQQEYTADELAVSRNPLATSLAGQPGNIGYCTLPNGERTSEPCYDTLANGAAACAKTLLAGYPTLVQALRAGDPSLFFSAQGLYELAVWAGGPGAPNYAYAQRVRDTYATLPPPPAWALSVAGGTVPGGLPPLFPAPSPWVAVGLMGGMLGGLALAVGLRTRR